MPPRIHEDKPSPPGNGEGNRLSAAMGDGKHQNSVDRSALRTSHGNVADHRQSKAGQKKGLQLQENIPPMQQPAPQSLIPIPHHGTVVKPVARPNTLVGPWELGREIGRGTSGTVRVARNKMTNEYAAVKVVKKLSNGKNVVVEYRDLRGEIKEHVGALPYGVEKEIAVLKLMDHPHVIGLKDVWESDEYLYLILEYVEGGELFRYIKNRKYLPEAEAVSYFRQIISACYYCQMLDICHRDLKPENILLTGDGMIKIADFGLASITPRGRHLDTSCGSPHYAAPEILSGEKYDGTKSDIWSCGIILYCLSCGKLPFDDKCVPLLLQKVKQGRFMMPDEFSIELKDLIWRMLRVNPDDRITFDQIWRHPLMTKYAPRDPKSGKDADRYPFPIGIDEVKGPLIKDKGEVDPETLKSMRILFKGVPDRAFFKQLRVDSPNDVKVVYSLLEKYRLKQLENYSGTVPDDIVVKPTTPQIFCSHKDCGAAGPSSFHSTPAKPNEDEYISSDSSSYDYTEEYAAKLQMMRQQRRRAMMQVQKRSGGKQQNKGESAAFGPKRGRRGKSRVSIPRSATFSSLTSNGNGTSLEFKVKSRKPSQIQFKRRTARQFQDTTKSDIEETPEQNKTPIRPRHRPSEGQGGVPSRRVSSATKSDQTTVLEKRESFIHHNKQDDFHGVLDEMDSKDVNGGQFHENAARHSLGMPSSESAIGTFGTTAGYRSTGATSNDESAEDTDKCKDDDKTVCEPPSHEEEEDIDARRTRLVKEAMEELERQAQGQDENRFLARQMYELELQGVEFTDLSPSDNELMTELRIEDGPGIADDDYGKPDDSIPIKSLPDFTTIPHAADQEFIEDCYSDDSDNSDSPEASDAESNTEELPDFASSHEGSDSEEVDIEEALMMQVGGVGGTSPLRVRRKNLRDGSGKIVRSSLRRLEDQRAAFTKKKRPVAPPPPMGPAIKIEDFEFNFNQGNYAFISAPPDEENETNNQLTKTQSEPKPESPKNTLAVPTLKKRRSLFDMFQRKSSSDLRGQTAADEKASEEKTVDEKPSEEKAAEEKAQSAAPGESKRLENLKHTIRRLKSRESRSDMLRPGNPTAKILEQFDDPSEYLTDNRNEFKRVVSEQNWIQRIFQVRPACEIIAFSLSAYYMRRVIISLWKSWSNHGLVIVQDDKAGLVMRARIDEKNALDLKEVCLVGEIRVVKGTRRVGTSAVRFTQEKGSASSFLTVVNHMHNILAEKALVIKSQQKTERMARVFNN